MTDLSIKELFVKTVILTPLFVRYSYICQKFGCDKGSPPVKTKNNVPISMASSNNCFQSKKVHSDDGRLSFA